MNAAAARALGTTTAARALAVSTALAITATAIGASATAFAQAEIDAPAGAFRYTRPIQDVERGWVRIPLGQELVGRLAPDGRDVRVFDPNGLEVPIVFAGRADARFQIAAQVVAVDEVEDGWTITLDTGLEPAAGARHDGLRLDFEEPVLAPGVRLTVSSDGLTWSELATADFFRLGDEPGLALTAVDYPATAARFVRIDWPAAAGFPELTTASVRPVPLDAPQYEVELTLVAGRAESGHASLGLVHPWLSQVVEAHVEWSGGSADHRLSAPMAGRWVVRSEGTLVHRENAASATRLSFGMAAADPEGGTSAAGAGMLPDTRPAPWRLELFARDDEPLPDVERVTALVVAPEVYFEADVAGEYTLAYGGAGLESAAAAASPPERWYGTLPRARLGAEVEHAAPTADPAAATAGGPMPDVAFDAAWPIVAPAAPAGAADAADSGAEAGIAGEAGDGPVPGAIVELELPETVLAMARADLADVRVAAGDRQVPYARLARPDPALVVAAIGLVPEVVTTDRGARRSAVAIALPAAGLPLSQIELVSRAGPFERDVSVAWVDEPEGLEELADPALRRRFVAARTWRCDAGSAAPCRIAFDLAADLAPAPASASASAPASGIEITFEDGDNQPLASLDAAVWRRRAVVRFMWPSGAAPRLLAGAADLAAPRYDLTPLRTALLTDAPTQASLGERLPQTGARGLAEAAERADFLPLAALGLAAIALLGLLWRLLRAQGTGAVAGGEGDRGA